MVTLMSGASERPDRAVSQDQNAALAAPITVAAYVPENPDRAGNLQIRARSVLRNPDIKENPQMES